MPGVTAALIGDLDVRRELGKVGTQSDLHLHDFRHDGVAVTTLVPDRYPDKLQPLSYALVGADAAVLAVSQVDARLGEQIVAAAAAGIERGVVVLRGYVQPDQVRPLLEGTALEAWPVMADDDWAAVRAHLAATPPPERDGPAVVPVDHHFDVKGVGAVVLGVVRRGTLGKGETLHGHPGRVICPLRSIQIHDEDVPQAVPGDRVGLALRQTKADQLDRGMLLCHPDADVRSLDVGDRVAGRLERSRFCRQELSAGSVVHLGVGMQFVPLRLDADAPAPGSHGALSGVLEKPLVHEPGEAGIVWHMDAPPQRVVGRVVLEA